MTPEVARNGNIFNLWSLSLKNGELKQYTDALGGVLSPVVLSKDGAAPKLAFVDYYKGSYTLHTFDLKEPLHTAASADFGSPGPITDFQAPLQHTLVAENKSKKGMFDKMFLDGRPPVNVGVTSGGDVFGGSMVSFTDVLGDQQFSMYASSVQQYKTLSFSYLNLSRRFQWALQGYSQTQFFYGQLSQYFYDPLDRAAHQPGGCARDADGSRRIGLRHLSVQHLSARRALRRPGALSLKSTPIRAMQANADEFQQETYGTQLFNSGMMMPLGVSFIQETTVFREYGPLSGSTMRLSYRRRAEDRQVAVASDDRRRRALLHADWRATACSPCGPTASRAGARRPATRSSAATPRCAATNTASSSGTRASTCNAELRFPLIHAMATPIGILGGIRGVFFFNIGGAGLEGPAFKVWDNNTFITDPIRDPNTGVIIRPAQRIDGFRLARLARVVRHRARDLRARLPGPFRLVVPHALQQGMGRLRLRQQQRIPQSAVYRLDGYDF